jgi:Ca-activated chloride channel family protein
MNISSDDPKLTAYALGELDKSEAAQLERELENSLECRVEIDNLKSFSALLREEFQRESVLKLSAEQKEGILMKTESSDNVSVSDEEKIVQFPFSKWLLYGGLTAAAACIMAGFFLPALSKAKNGTRRTSHLQTSSYDPYWNNHASFPAVPARLAREKFSSRREPRMFNERELVETARYPKYAENDFQSVSQEPRSTFSIDVDTASYANVRRFLNEDRLPPRDAVRIEELINYFSYNYPQPKGDESFSANLEVAGCPWNPQHRLVRIGLKGKEIAQDKRPPSNFVFLIDVSGSMSPSERLPLIKQALRMLVKRMTENDRIAIVVYASSSGVVLKSTSCANKEKILAALDHLEAGGSTNGGEGVQRAYALAEENFIKGGVNRVILCTDGDFNVGITDQSELINLIQRKAKSGVFLSALGVGTDNYKDALMQKLADKGNGNYYYIDSMEEAQKVLIQQMNGTLVTIAKDAKIQIEFNPAQVSSYRLIGYEKRMLAAEDFNNDKKDSGEIGAGHTVTALYEIVPANSEENGAREKVDDLKYQKPTPKPKREVNNDNPELLTMKLRYKKPDGKTSKLSETALTDSGEKFSQASSDFRFASAVAGFGMILKNSEHKGDWTFKSVLDVAEHSKGDDKEGYRAEFINLVKKAKALHQRD